MKKNILLIILTLIFSLNIFAQENVNTAQKTEQQAKKKSLVAGTNLPKKNMTERNVVPYPETEEADVVWQRKIWRAIELSEKINHPLYFPTIELSTHKSFIQSLVDGIEKGEIVAYNEDFTDTLSIKAIREQFDAQDRQYVEEKLDGSGDTTIFVKGYFNWGEVKELLVTEEWFFDKRYSQMFVRIVGICPVRVFQRSIATADGDEEKTSDYSKKQLFWIYYPDARKYLAKTLCYTSKNEAAPMSYDDVFQRRKFSSRVISEGLSMNNRHVDDYSRSGLEAMLESLRLENEIINTEHDFWEY
ncbi:MAG: gliding motility protein GldN [Prevotellaceae bacterium]|jgi:gliding motility associated protien GldN|nr:gliding motility protein GldN [Prevotellaceae bacterium]